MTFWLLISMEYDTFPNARDGMDGGDDWWWPMAATGHLSITKGFLHYISFFFILYLFWEY